ncbi:MAG: 4-hydroxy-3-methylbut-2-en-1-yl diphosphate synthase [Deltaproteobacteria bacterium GWC2_56_8]|nr:MAG: 4-hydroxy-3-methylbut-2-en-1-yl diphosphate synthase [Deltaproteobacteria bacterium GWB2_55_19]OGP32866.1 MAG: 4-hydroxy-3-methylbut-2-en-1-yl diphosphate synthase [Deltaproteobacteria bacterium GWC2_56_8]HAO92908.1 4-hydroxy-3-methylbut-2-en-1-yl diphosphate synthase [Deltaproteobacteria bacterium]
MTTRRKTREIKIGDVSVGGDAPVTVQSMTNTDTSDVKATVAQIKALEAVGCEIVRVAVPNEEAAGVLGRIIKEINIPLIADIHFDWRLALKALDEGVQGLRLNPGNIGSKERIGEVVKAAKERRVPIRIGVNAGSLEKDILERHGHPTKEALVESAMRHISILEDMDFRDIKISLKASSVPLTVESYRLLATKVDYPFHIGITEAGTTFGGTIKSSVGLGVLLYDGIGDTLRVSLTGDPVDEVKVGWEILKSLGLRKRGVNIISCPTCGRIKLDSIRIATEVEKRLSHIVEPLNVAIMGCVVNGPGEAVESDVGIAGGDGVGFIYVKGEAMRKVKEADIVEALIDEVEKIVEARKRGG